jgi:glyoxylase-like metal-dependent hydrolase (beta-lactamase superfamily II)
MCKYPYPIMARDRLQSLGIRTIPVTDTISIIQGDNRGRSPFSNAIFVHDRKNLLMDTGCGIDILRHLKAGFSMDSVILSHSHLDHTAGTWLFQDIPGTDILVSEQGSDSIGSADRLALRFVGQDLAQVWKETYIPMTGFKDFRHTATFSHGCELPTGRGRFITLHAPGHLEDHYCLWEPDRRILVGFDIDMSPFGPWYGSPESDIARFKRSIEKIKSLPVEIYISSHARPMKSPHFFKRLASYLTVFDKRDHRIMSLIPARGGISLEALLMSSPVYEADYTSNNDRLLKFGEKTIILKHLLALESRGLVSRDSGGLYHRLT